MELQKSITSVIENSIPLFVRLEYPRFTEFITLYYSKEQEAGSGYEFLANMFDYANIDRTTLAFLENFANQYLCCIPGNVLPDINKRTLIKHIREYYTSIGSEASIKFLFRILFNETIELYYPRIDMLRVSDGKWQNDRVIKVTNSLLGEELKDLEGTEIMGEISRARALVDKVVTYVATNGFYVAELFLTEIDPVFPINSFRPLEYITGIGLNGGINFREKILYILNSASVISSGLYNAPGDIVEVKSNVGVDAFIIVDTVTSGSIDSLDIIDGGLGYNANEIIIFSSGSGAHARAKIKTVNGAGTITSTEMINTGYGYKELPTVSFENSIGTGAILYPVSTNIGKINKLKIINFGVNYDPDESESFPYTFPINFSSVLAEVKTYKILFYYNNITPFIQSEVITGQTSGATGVIRFLKNGHIMTVYQTSLTDFIPSEEIIGGTSGTIGVIHVVESSTISITSGAVGSLSGYFSTTDSFLSSNKYIQDSYYYQDFSYVINTLRPKEQWINQLKEAAHPSGSIVFGFGEGNLYTFYSYYEDNFISALWDTSEFYKNLIGVARYNYGESSVFSNAQIKDFYDVPVYYFAQLSPDEYTTDPNGDELNTPHKTNFCIPSSVKISFEGTFYINIDNTNVLLVDSTNSLLL